MISWGSQSERFPTFKLFFNARSRLTSAPRSWTINFDFTVQTPFCLYKIPILLQTIAVDVYAKNKYLFIMRDMVGRSEGERKNTFKVLEFGRWAKFCEGKTSSDVHQAGTHHAHKSMNTNWFCVSQHKRQPHFPQVIKIPFYRRDIFAATKHKLQYPKVASCMVANVSWALMRPTKTFLQHAENKKFHRVKQRNFLFLFGRRDNIKRTKQQKVP